MELDALMKIHQIVVIKRKKTELYLIIGFNLIMYSLLGVYCVFKIYDIRDYDFNLVARSFKASLEFVIGFAMITSAIKLAMTVKKLMHSVPGNIVLWLIVGSVACLIKCAEQVTLYYLEKTETEAIWIYVLLFFSYNLDDVLPCIVFIKSFKVYSRFLRKNRDSFDSFDDSLDERLKTILAQSLKD